MRNSGLKLLSGGGKPEAKECELCALNLYILGEDAEADEAARAAILEYLKGKKKEGRITLCTSHREDVDALGGRTRSVVSEAPNRKKRRHAKAVIQRAHRRSLPRAADPHEVRTNVRRHEEPGKPGSNGGLTF